MMRSKKMISLLLVLAILMGWKYFIPGKINPGNDRPETETVVNTEKKDISGKDEYLNDLRSKPLQYTKHARCRMACRQINEKEVMEILTQGQLNWQKTDLHDQPCPSFALEGITSDRQKVRIVYAGCEEETRVVTAIDLDTDWPCECP